MDTKELLSYLRTLVGEKVTESGQGNATGTHWTNLELMRALNRAQEYYWGLIVRSQQNYFLTSQTYSYVAEQELYDLPSKCQKIISFQRVDYDPPRPVWPTDINQRYVYKEIDDGYDRFYLQKDQFGILPVPAAANASCLKLWYIYRPIEIHYGTAQAGAVTYITLDDSATVGDVKVENDYYNDATVRIVSGTGAGQDASVTDYVGSTKVATAAFTTAPDNTSVYSIQPVIPEPFHQLLAIRAAISCKAGDEKNIRAWQEEEGQLAAQMLSLIRERTGNYPSVVDPAIEWLNEF